MSQDRYLANDDAAPAAAGRRCSLDHAKKAREHYCGTVRGPRYPDEKGALVVVDLVFSDGARRAFFPLQGIDQCSVVDLPAMAK